MAALGLVKTRRGLLQRTLLHQQITQIKQGIQVRGLVFKRLAQGRLCLTRLIIRLVSKAQIRQRIRIMGCNGHAAFARQNRLGPVVAQAMKRGRVFLDSGILGG